MASDAHAHAHTDGHGHAPETSQGAEHEADRAPGGLNVGLIALVGIVGTILVYVTVLACTAAYYEIRERKRESLQTFAPVQVERYLEQQEMLLEGVYWTNKDKNLVSIPIDQAMDMVAQQGLQSGAQ